MIFYNDKERLLKRLPPGYTTSPRAKALLAVEISKLVLLDHDIPVTGHGGQSGAPSMLDHLLLLICRKSNANMRVIELSTLHSRLDEEEVINANKIRRLDRLSETCKPFCKLQRHPLRDATSNGVLLKFDTTIFKKFKTQLEDFSKEEYRKLSELHRLFEPIPEDDEGVLRRKGIKRYVVTRLGKHKAQRKAFWKHCGNKHGKIHLLVSPEMGYRKRKETEDILAIYYFEELDGAKEGTPPENLTRAMPKRNT
ncbi:hypothetical protein M378DRAFT_11710 [Amanita muscaria Koide BX008]|uniref:Uncharacterized protein n=1 Tax=Amanita muscaria (strain Koide BX008) TaxID=946122 RepID=A0A0C2WR55_AMAMK|nr:hypothetical protein M378DRAFT_11710 [Amanita muscaria Koide BX008]